MKRLHACLGLAILLAWTGLPAFAEENSADLFAEPAGESKTENAAKPEAPSAPGSAEKAFTLKFSGSHEFGYHVPADKDSYDYEGEMKGPAFKNDVGIEIQNGDVKLVSRWAFDILQDRREASSASGSGHSNDQYGSWDTLTRLRPLENYLSWSPAGKGVKASFGYQIFAWGVADKANPTDNLNPRDYTSSPIDPAKIPVLAADLLWYPSSTISVEAVFVPFEQTDLWPGNFADAVKAKTKTSGAVGYEPLDYSPENFTAGGKLSYRGEAGDYSVSYLYDIDPYYSPTINGRIYSSAPTAAITLERDRIHRFGADAKTTVGKFGLWAETCYSLTGWSSGDDTTRRSKLEYVLGFDFNYGPNDTYYVNFQYLGSFIPGFEYGEFDRAQALNPVYGEAFYRRALTDSVGMATEGLLQGLSLNLKFELLDSLLTPELKAVYLVPFQYDDSAKVRYGSLALTFELDLMPVDSFHIVLGTDLAYSWYRERGSNTVRLDTTSDKLGIYTPFNNVYLKVLYKWNYDLTK